MTNDDLLTDFYRSAYFARQGSTSFTSAKRIVPIVMEVLNPSSVIDVGCGVGAWLRCFRDLGVSRVLGIDGEYVDRSLLYVEQDEFLSRDLAQPLELTERFDLALALEVACDLPAEHGERFVQDLVQLAPAVLFSSAIPHQGGGLHLNMRWQSYWVEMFRRHDYVSMDVIRPAVWWDESVDWWYAQNALLYVQREAVPERFRESLHEPATAHLDVVAPRYYLYQRARLQRPGVRSSLRMLLLALARTAARGLRRGLKRLVGRLAGGT